MFNTGKQKIANKEGPPTGKNRDNELIACNTKFFVNGCRLHKETCSSVLLLWRWRY